MYGVYATGPILMRPSAFLEHYHPSAFLESISNGLNRVVPVTDAMYNFMPVFQ
jgi:hypothetical protein